MTMPCPTCVGVVAGVVVVAPEIAGAFEEDPFVDLELGDAIGTACLILLEEYDNATDGEKRAIQVACDYYVEMEDHNNDLKSVVGFDDDAYVLNAVCDWLGRAELRVEVE